MAGASQNIEHIVVLMLENRSFDHLFGAFPGANGVLAEDRSIKPDLYNLEDPTNPQSPKHFPYAITPDVQLNHDLNHDFCNGMMSELFGPGTTGVLNGAPLRPERPLYPATNPGFYSTPAWNADGSGNTPNGEQSLSYYEHDSLKVLHTLASEFVLCDNWFCDTPGDTLLNRYFMHAAQTGNTITDDQGIAPLECQTLFNRLGDDRWRMYGAQSRSPDGRLNLSPMDTRFLQDVLDSPNALPMRDFVRSAGYGTLPLYSFLMCWLPNAPGRLDTSMHPIEDVRAGENYLAAVYNAVRRSPVWDKILLVVTFDENGGFYDHVAPPAAVPPVKADPALAFDPFLGVECTFDFTRLGPRVPALLISPWLGKGIARGQFQNSSIVRFIAERAGVGTLNARDGEAPRLEAIFDEFGQAKPRTDCPAKMPTYDEPGLPYPDGNLADIYVVPPDAAPAPAGLRAKLERIYGRSASPAA